MKTNRFILIVALLGLFFIGLGACMLSAHAQEVGDKSAVSSSFAATQSSLPDTVLTPGDYDTAARKADVCTDKYAAIPPIPDAIAAKVWENYKSIAPEAFRREWTLVYLVPPQIGGHVSAANIFPVYNGGFYTAVQMADLALALRKQTCNGPADADGKILNALRAEVADNWVSVHVQYVGALFPPDKP